MQALFEYASIWHVDGLAAVTIELAHFVVADGVAAKVGFFVKLYAGFVVVS